MVLSELCRLHLGKEVELIYNKAVFKGTLKTVTHMQTFTSIRLEMRMDTITLDIDASKVEGHIVTVFR